MNSSDFRRKLTEESIRQEFEQTFTDRVERYLQVRPHGVIPNIHFARASSECSKLYRDAHFLGCISLAQAVTESLCRFVCSVNGFSPASNFEKNVKTLLKNDVISDEQEKHFLEIWNDRDHYHHLNPQIESDYLKLMELAKEKLLLLNKTEEFFFGLGFDNGALVPHKPQYWTTGREVYLRLD